MSTYTREQVSNLVEGKLDRDATLRMLAMPKDAQRFGSYLAALQRKLGWSDSIVLPLGPHLHIVQQARTSKWVTQCDCCHVFCDWRDNWKLHARISVRDNEEAMSQVHPKQMAPDTKRQVCREYYCPRCGALHDMEASTPWFPVIHDLEPDIDAFYKESVKLPLPERID
jgi:acetone carboxylase gamma subunit